MSIFESAAGYAGCEPVALLSTPEELVRLDLARSSRVRIDSAKSDGDTVVLEGYVAPNIWIEVRMPSRTWTQRLVVIAPGGYGGAILREPWPSSPLRTLPGAEQELVIATYDTGHRGARNFAADGLWAVDDPQAVIDFAYDALHRVTVAVKGLIEAAYGRPAAYSYVLGMSSGGRIGLASAQRYPEDFDGVASDCPTIDMVSTNTYWHAWNAKINTGSEGRPILTRDRLRGLHTAVLRAAEEQGLRVGNAVRDPRLLQFDPASLSTYDVPADERLSIEQVRVVEALYAGPTTADGVRLFPLGLPVGSELAWDGLMIPRGDDPQAPLSVGNASEMMWSNEFPDFMSSFAGPTGVRGPDLQYTVEEFDRLHELSSLYDPTNPDLRTFADTGAKLLIWQGWADPASSPYSVLNYFSAARTETGEGRFDDAVALYMVPGMYHGGVGPDSSHGDYLSPLMQWVETGRAPASIDVVFDHASSKPSDPWPLERYRSQPDVVPDVVEWYGSKHYDPSFMRWGVVPRPHLVTTAEHQSTPLD